jgi:CBF/Mak21 family
VGAHSTEQQQQPVEEEEDEYDEGTDDPEEKEPPEQRPPWNGWSFRDDPTLYKMLQMECIGPYRDVQYYIMSSIVTVANEIYQQQQQHQKKKNSSSTTGRRSRTGDEDPATCLVAYAVMVERLMELLIMIPPIPSTQREFDSHTSTSSSNSSPYLIPPRNPSQQRTTTTGVARRNKKGGKNDDDSSNDSNDDDHSDHDVESTTSDDTDCPDDDDDDDIENKTLAGGRTSHQQLSYTNVQRHQSVCGKAWLAVLRLLRLPSTTRTTTTTVVTITPCARYYDSIMKQSLQYIPKYVLPIVSYPLRFADFFHMAYSYRNSSSNGQNGTVIPLLALEGLFHLMTQHGLEYKNFYKQLYTIINTPSIYYIKYRTSFLKLMDKCLIRNDMLPTHIVAAFTKRLLRNALYVSPSSIMFILTFVSNLLRKHPEMSCLIHRTAAAVSSSTDGGMNDGYNADTDDPELANALKSSLWELHALQKHYYAGIVTLASSIGCENYEQTLPYDTSNEFVAITYTTLFEQERSTRKRKRTNNSTNPDPKVHHRHLNDGTDDKSKSTNYPTTPLAFHAPTSLFTSSDIFSTLISIPTLLNCKEE